MSYNTPKEATSLGGKTAATTVYRCPICGSMGSGNRFVNQHLAEGCKGPGKKTLKAQNKYKGREQEAMTNTAIWNANKTIQQEREMFNDMKSRIEADIERMKEIGNEFQEKPIF